MLIQNRGNVSIKRPKKTKQNQSLFYRPFLIVAVVKELAVSGSAKMVLKRKIAKTCTIFSRWQTRGKWTIWLRPCFLYSLASHYQNLYLVRRTLYNHLNSRGCQVKIGQISFCKRLKSKQHHVKVPRERFHLNGHTKGFRPQTRKLEAPCKTQSLWNRRLTFIMHKEY